MHGWKHRKGTKKSSVGERAQWRVQKEHRGSSTVCHWARKCAEKRKGGRPHTRWAVSRRQGLWAPDSPYALLTCQDQPSPKGHSCQEPQRPSNPGPLGIIPYMLPSDSLSTSSPPLPDLGPPAEYFGLPGAFLLSQGTSVYRTCCRGGQGLNTPTLPGDRNQGQAWL